MNSMNKHDKPSAESAGNEGNPEVEFEFIGTRGLSKRLLEDVTEIIKKYVKALPNAVDCDREVEMQFYSTRMMRLTPKPEASENGDMPS